MEDAEAPEVLTEAELTEPVIEAAGTRMVIPRKGKLFDEDGVCEVVVIRPCVSRGKRIKGLPPIYTPEMLAENASVYSGWLMFMDHLTERIVEALVQEGRSIRELGGRVLRSWWDPSVRFRDDDDFGFRPGGVAAKVLPQPPVRRMLEADPEILNVSHNAWPKGARRGRAPWDSTLEGYLIEGIRPRPEGSVDWVPRGGAGGRMRLEEMREWETFAVGILGSGYSAPSREDDQVTDFAKMTEKELREQLTEKNPGLAESLGITRDAPPASVTVTGPTREDLTSAIREAVSPLQEKLTDLEENFEERVEERVKERLSESAFYTKLEEHARTLIKSAGLGPRWTANLQERYSVLPSGPSGALTQAVQLAEDESLESRKESLKGLVEADVTHARELIAESSGVPVPGGLGGGGGQAASPRSRRSSGAFREFLAESHRGEGKVDDDTIKEMVREGATS